MAHNREMSDEVFFSSDYLSIGPLDHHNGGCEPTHFGQSEKFKMAATWPSQINSSSISASRPLRNIIQNAVDMFFCNYELIEIHFKLA